MVPAVMSTGSNPAYGSSAEAIWSNSYGWGTDDDVWQPIFSGASDAFFFVGYGANRRVEKTGQRRRRKPPSVGFRASETGHKPLRGRRTPSYR